MLRTEMRLTLERCARTGESFDAAWKALRQGRPEPARCRTSRGPGARYVRTAAPPVTAEQLTPRQLTRARAVVAKAQRAATARGLPLFVGLASLRGGSDKKARKLLKRAGKLGDALGLALEEALAYLIATEE
jgi:hypothetical protein